MDRTGPIARYPSDNIKEAPAKLAQIILTCFLLMKDNLKSIRRHSFVPGSVYAEEEDDRVTPDALSVPVPACLPFELVARVPTCMHPSIKSPLTTEYLPLLFITTLWDIRHCARPYLRPNARRRLSTRRRYSPPSRKKFVRSFRIW